MRGTFFITSVVLLFLLLLVAANVKEDRRNLTRAPGQSIWDIAR